MSDLGDKLVEIKRQKDEYILPENIRKNVTVYGVTGTLETGSGSGDIKLFETVEEMQQDMTAQKGDLAVIYRTVTLPVTNESEFNSCVFPNTVVLDEAFADYISGDFMAISGSSSYFSGMFELSDTSFTFEGYGDTTHIQISYTSSDGITYTRTDGGEELQEFEATIQYDIWGEQWNSVVGNFMRTNSNYFDGIYVYEDVVDTTKFQFRDINSLQYNSNNTITYNDNLITGKYDYSALAKIRSKAWSDGNKSTCCYLGTDNKIYLVGTDGENVTIWKYLFENGNLKYIGDGNAASSDTNVTKFNVYQVNLEDNTYSLYKTINAVTVATKFINYSQERTVNIKCIPISELNMKSLLTTLNMNDVAQINVQVSDKDYFMQFTNPGDESENRIDIETPYKNLEYTIVKTQINATKDDVINVVYFGKDGSNLGTLENNTNISVENMVKRIELYNLYKDMTIDSTEYSMYDTFRDNKIIKTLPILDLSMITDMSNAFHSSSLEHLPALITPNVTNMNSFCYGCTNLITVDLIDTGKVTNFSWGFAYCENLVNVPVLDTKSITSNYMSAMFKGCNSLSNESLNNIMQMCINAVNVTSAKSLESVGLNTTQRETCKSLSNYQAFINAGWKLNI